ncbi:MAG: glycosyltransferase family 2 protein [Candidatus Portiera sp.]|nr:glycosyltransferase family 2 protein [Portiera sp.]
MKTLNKESIVVSVIMATYNRYDLLPRAIDSILAQTLKNFEFIIIDDGSTDATAKLLQEYSTKDSRIKIITQENQGLAASRNNGAANAKAKYIAFIDSDDACAVNRLELQVGFLEQNYQYPACSLGQNPSIDDYYPGVVADTNYTYTWYKTSPFHTKKVFSILGPNSMMTKESFIRVGGNRTQPTIIEDLDFTLRYSNHYAWALIYNMNTYFYTSPSTTNKGLVNDNVLTFPKRHLACYVSEWCRVNGHPDPVEQGKPLEEIISMVRAMTRAERLTVYIHLRYFAKTLSLIEGMTMKQAKRYLLSLITNSDFESRWIEIRFVISLPFSYIIKALMTRLKRWLSRFLH